MLRISYAMGVAAALLLQSASSFAAEGDDQVILAPQEISPSTQLPKSNKIYQTAASTIQGEGDQLARSDAASQKQSSESESASNPVTMEYPALALLAIAIISMAALSRRDSLRIDR